MKINKENEIPKRFINAQSRGRESIFEVFRHRNAHYQEGLPYLIDDKTDISSAIEDLREMNVFDYDEHSSQIYMTEDYERFLQIYSDTNIADIKKKQSSIISLINNINARKKEGQDYSSEIRSINRNLMNIKKSLNVNLKILNEMQLKFKGESNLQVKKDNLNDCKTELESLSVAINVLDRFLISKKKYLIVELSTESITHNVNALISELKFIRENIIKILNELTRYLLHIEKEIEKIKHINKLYKIKHSSELYEKTNIENVFRDVKLLPKKIKPINLFYNDYDLVDSLVEVYEEKMKKPLEKMIEPKAAPKKVVSNKNKKTEKRVIVGASIAYKMFIKQDLDLGTYLSTLDIDRKKFISLFIRILLNHNMFLNINRKETLTINKFTVPTVTKRI